MQHHTPLPCATSSQREFNELRIVSEFQEFLKVMENKKKAESIGDGAEICKLSLDTISCEEFFQDFPQLFSPLTPILHDHAVQAYVACGGSQDKTGHVDRKTITRIIKEDFGLDIDIDKLMDAVDTDGSGEMEYNEFELLLSGKARHT